MYGFWLVAVWILVSCCSGRGYMPGFLSQISCYFIVSMGCSQLSLLLLSLKTPLQDSIFPSSMVCSMNSCVILEERPLKLSLSIPLLAQMLLKQASQLAISTTNCLLLGKV